MAAPTAGFHFTTAVFEELRALGYEGAEPKTKGDVGALIAEYKARNEKE